MRVVVRCGEWRAKRRSKLGSTQEMKTERESDVFATVGWSDIPKNLCRRTWSFTPASSQFRRPHHKATIPLSNSDHSNTTRMAFHKRNVGLSSGSIRTPEASSSPPTPPLPGTRPSPLDGRLTTSTGTPTLDNLLAGHAGLALGNSLLIEETGTTDFSGSLLRYYAAEGVVQGHIVHIVGVGPQWGRALPGLTGAGEGDDRGIKKDEKMKIAWRYERLGEFGAVAGSRGWLTIHSLLICEVLYISSLWNETTVQDQS